MHTIRIAVISILMILLLCPGFAESGVLSIPRAEYMIAAIDLTSPNEVTADLFYAFTVDSIPQTSSRLTFWDLPTENIANVKVNDYLFFDARYIAPYDKDFIDDDNAMFYNNKQTEQIEGLAIYLFQEPFWSVHLAFRLPTSLLEWQRGLREKYTGHDVWPQAFDAIDYKLPDEIQFEKIPLPNKAGFTLSYFLPKRSEKLTTRGVTFEYRELLMKDQDPMTAVEKILNTSIHYAGTGERLWFPLYRFYVKTKPGNNGVFLESFKGSEMDLDSLVHRISTRDSGSYYNQSGLVLNDMLLERLVLYENPPTDKTSIRAKSTAIMKGDEFHAPTNPPSRISGTIRIARFMIIGLVSWMVFFLLSHYRVFRGSQLLKTIGLSLGAYFVYLLVSTIFLFMYGFGFLLGIIAMESMIHRTSYGAKFPAWKLFSYGLVTSVLTALVVYFIGV